jgi:hypothetical protein
MHSEPAIEAPASPAVATIQEAQTETTGAPAPPRAGRQPVRFVLGKMMRSLRGDAYMEGAYPPEWPPSSARPHDGPGNDDAAAPVAAALSATPSKER